MVSFSVQNGIHKSMHEAIVMSFRMVVVKSSVDGDG